MNAITLAINSPLMHTLGWTLVHFIWQGACVGLIYGVLRHVLRFRSPATRYHLAMLTLAVMAFMPIVTLWHLLGTYTPAATGESATSFATAVTILDPVTAQAAGTQANLLGMVSELLQRMVPWAVPFWLLGVMIMSLRVWRGWEHTRMLRRTAVLRVLPAWEASVDKLRDVLGIDKVVQIAVSAGVTVPSVIGWLKPIILIPPSVLTGLTPLQMELVLAHELAHIRRQDYLWNLLQLFVDTLLFYHPVVRWVSRHARMEREQCCDDIVVNLNGDAINYARALTELERLRTPRSSMVLGADGGQVIHRIHRLIGIPAVDISPLSWAVPLLALSLLITGSLTKIPFQAPTIPYFHAPTTATPSASTPATQAQDKPSLQPTHVAITNPRFASLHLVEQVTPFTPVTLTKPLSSLQRAQSGLATVTQNKNPAPVRTGGTILERHPPQYPQYALERDIEGSATVSFTLSASGEITHVRVIDVRGSQLFGQAAVNAMKQWKIAPVTLNGIPVEQSMTQEFDFRLNSPGTTVGTCRIPIGFHICSRN